MEQALTKLGRFTSLTEGPGSGDSYIQLSNKLLDTGKGNPSVISPIAYASTPSASYTSSW